MTVPVGKSEEGSLFSFRDSLQEDSVCFQYRMSFRDISSTNLLFTGKEKPPAPWECTDSNVYGVHPSGTLMGGGNKWTFAGSAYKIAARRLYEEEAKEAAEKEAKINEKLAKYKAEEEQIELEKAQKQKEREAALKEYQKREEMQKQKSKKKAKKQGKKSKKEKKAKKRKKSSSSDSSSSSSSSSSQKRKIARLEEVAKERADLDARLQKIKAAKARMASKDEVVDGETADLESNERNVRDEDL